ncbi:hypothetical protein [Pedobacter lusitanus]|uniref:hypothetical protein n=1 Tax=Pedobacter lusitanus TaxID=1503925 RepID=UPI0006960D72|nr:hypothetical protein [Pedobacter lusitanus]
MKKAVFLVILLIAIKSYAAEPEIREVKNLFSASAYSKASADQLLKLLSATGESSPALFICYKGAAEMMQAKYGFNPVNKFKRFKKGRSLIENAVKKEPDNLEIRFLRFLIQTNLPSFLNYNNDIHKDRNYLLANLKTTDDKELRQNILKYLSSKKITQLKNRKD